MKGFSLSNLISDYAQAALGLSLEERAKMRYSLQVFSSELTKLGALLLFFGLFGVQGLFLQAMVPLALIRTQTGGLHFKTYWGCLGFSTAFFSAVLLLYMQIPAPRLFQLIIGAVALTVIFASAPVTSPNRPAYSDTERLRFRTTGCLIAALHLLGFWAIKNNPYFTLSVWVIFLQAIQLYIAKVVEKHEAKATV